MHHLIDVLLPQQSSPNRHSKNLSHYQNPNPKHPNPKHLGRLRGIRNSNCGSCSHSKEVRFNLR